MIKQLSELYGAVWPILRQYVRFNKIEGLSIEYPKSAWDGATRPVLVITVSGNRPEIDDNAPVMVSLYVSGYLKETWNVRIVYKVNQGAANE